jgi:ABC-2 type transport system ATP-binding protein
MELIDVAVLEIEHLTYSYDRTTNVLVDVSMTVEAGTVVGLIGPNGSGKSTLINTVFDLLRVQSGVIRVDGIPHEHRDARSRAIHLASNDYLPDFLTAREYLSMIAQLYRVELDHTRAADLFRDFSMEGRYDDLIEDFSHGMRKKTQVISALLVRRPLTVIDETLNGIDVEALERSTSELENLRSQGHAVLLCTHDFALLERVADRIVLLDFGMVVLDEPTADLVGRDGGLSELVMTYLATGSR